MSAFHVAVSGETLAELKVNLLATVAALCGTDVSAGAGTGHTYPVPTFSRSRKDNGAGYSPMLLA